MIKERVRHNIQIHCPYLKYGFSLVSSNCIVHQTIIFRYRTLTLWTPHSLCIAIIIMAIIWDSHRSLILIFRRVYLNNLRMTQTTRIGCQYHIFNNSNNNKKNALITFINRNTNKVYSSNVIFDECVFDNNQYLFTIEENNSNSWFQFTKCNFTNNAENIIYYIPPSLSPLTSRLLMLSLRIVSGTMTQGHAMLWQSSIWCVQYLRFQFGNE